MRRYDSDIRLMCDTLKAYIINIANRRLGPIPVDPTFDMITWTDDIIIDICQKLSADSNKDIVYDFIDNLTGVLSQPRPEFEKLSVYKLDKIEILSGGSGHNVGDIIRVAFGHNNSDPTEIEPGITNLEVTKIGPNGEVEEVIILNGLFLKNPSKALYKFYYDATNNTNVSNFDIQVKAMLFKIAIPDTYDIPIYNRNIRLTSEIKISPSQPQGYSEVSIEWKEVYNPLVVISSYGNNKEYFLKLRGDFVERYSGTIDYMDSSGVIHQENLMNFFTYDFTLNFYWVDLNIFLFLNGDVFKKITIIDSIKQQPELIIVPEEKPKSFLPDYNNLNVAGGDLFLFPFSCYVGFENTDPSNPCFLMANGNILTEVGPNERTPYYIYAPNSTFTTTLPGNWFYYNFI